MKRSILFCVFVFSQNAFAIDYDACSKMLNNGWYKKYEYGGIDQPLTKATKKHGSSKGTSATSTEGSTATFDPGYTTNVYTSHTQFTSSWGACDSIALERLEKIRENYYAQNKPEILKQMARGQGPHLDVLASLNLCDAESRSSMATQFQKNIRSFMDVQEGGYGKAVDSLIHQETSLSSACLPFI